MTTTVDADLFAEQWREWHAGQEALIGDRHGFLAVTNIHWLEAAPQRFPDAPGEWWTDDQGVHVTLEDGVALEVADDHVTGRHDFGVIPERGGVTAVWDDHGTDVALEVAKRGGYDIVRPRHPDAPLVRGYHGTPAYEPDPRWAVPARFVAFDAPRPTTVGGAVEGITHVYDAPGRVEFQLDGRDLALTVFANEHGAGYLALFTDETSGVTTYAANRSLRLDVPDADGALVLDFNRATNLPCAYTDLATCPLPPAENRLPIAVEAGERIPLERRGDA